MKKLISLLMLPGLCMATVLPVHWNRVNYISDNHYQMITRAGYYYRQIPIETIACGEKVSRNAQLVQTPNGKVLNFMSGAMCTVKKLG